MVNQDSQIVIRACREDDLPDVLLLMQQLNEVTHNMIHFSLGHLQELYMEMAKQPNFYTNLVCELQGEVVGFLSLIFYRTLFHRGGTALINELIIDQEQRGQGLGRKLIEHAISEARARGMDEVEVGTETNNQAAQAFYRQAGFAKEYMLMGMVFEE